MHGANGRMGEIQGQFPWLQNSFVCINGNFSATPTPALRLKGKQDPLQTHGSKTEVQNAPICLLQKKVSSLGENKPKYVSPTDKLYLI